MKHAIHLLKIFMMQVYNFTLLSACFSCLVSYLPYVNTSHLLIHLLLFSYYSCFCFCHSPCFSLCFPWSFPSCFPEGLLVSIWMTSQTLYLLFLDILCHSNISQPLFFLQYSQIVPSLFTQNRLLKALCYKSIY